MPRRHCTTINSPPLFPPEARSVQTLGFLIGLHLKAVQPATTNINLKSNKQCEMLKKMFFVSIYLKMGGNERKLQAASQGNFFIFVAFYSLNAQTKKSSFIRNFHRLSLPPSASCKEQLFHLLHRFKSQFLCTIILVVWFKHSLFFKLKRLDDKNWRHVSFES